MDTLLNQRAHSPPSITPVSADGKMAIRQPGESRKNLRFETVSMHDLSAGGFSFWADVWPRYASCSLLWRKTIGQWWPIFTPGHDQRGRRVSCEGPSLAAGRLAVYWDCRLSQI